MHALPAYFCIRAAHQQPVYIKDQSVCLEIGQVGDAPIGQLGDATASAVCHTLISDRYSGSLSKHPPYTDPVKQA
jgi:hypothetical protein